MESKKLNYSNGRTTFHGELYWDGSASGKRPGVIVFPEAFGLNDHARERGKRLVELGYVALVADPHGEGRQYADVASLGEVLGPLFTDRAEWRSRAQAAFDTLVAQPEVDGSKVAAIGFCFGGATCLELARAGAPLSAIATFHSGIVPELAEDAGRISAKVLICHGAGDPLVQKGTIDAVMAEFERDKVDWQFIHYGNAVHSFTDPEADARNTPGLAYNALAERRSWAVMRDLFAEVFA